MQLSGTHVLITGASSGIGRQLALDLLERGARVTSFERTAAEAATALWTSIRADIRLEDDVRKACAQITQPVDVLINNAGVMRRGGVLTQSSEDFDALMETNVKGSWLVLKYAQPLLRDGAVVLQMSSRHALSLPEDPALYGLSKRFVSDLAGVFAKAYPQYRVKILCPGPVDTPLARHGVSEKDFAVKQKIMCSPREISARILELIETDEKTRLMFDARTNTYLLE